MYFFTLLRIETMKKLYTRSERSNMKNTQTAKNRSFYHFVFFLFVCFLFCSITP